MTRREMVADALRRQWRVETGAGETIAWPLVAAPEQRRWLALADRALEVADATQ